MNREMLKAAEEELSLENRQLDTERIETSKVLSSSFLTKQKGKLLQLRDDLLDSMTGISRDTLHSRAKGSEASAFGMHQADAGSDACDLDFALSLLLQEQDALHEIEEALRRGDKGTYGVCEMSGRPIPHSRLKAIPFECQSQIEKQKRRIPPCQTGKSLFGLIDEKGGEGEEEAITDWKD